ncbi:MAG TPA: choice-of-anchor J domain-containing protein [Flavobacterium sp.]|jgi:hypothetical protein
MKINIFKYMLVGALSAGLFTACDTDTELPAYTPVVLGQDFNQGADNTLLDIPGWMNFAQEGTAKWKIQQFSGNGYAEFSSFLSAEAVNVGWLITPAFTLEEGNSKKLRFQASQSFVSSPANTLQILVSTNFDGTNVAAATWTPVDANLPGTDAEYFEFFDSGEISLAGFSGNTYVAFKVTGSGTNTSLDGSYQIDNVKVY